jgi:electron transfer flavoprotein alpha subunit
MQGRGTAVTDTILVYVDHEGGRPKRTGLELVSKAAELAAGGKVAAVVLGPGSAAAAEQLGRYGADDVYVDESGAFAQYLNDPHVEAIEHVVVTVSPAVVLFTDTLDERDIAARLAARLDSGLVSAVVDLTPHDGHIDATETIFGGSITTTVEVRNSQLAIFLVRPNAFPLTEHGKTAAVHEIGYAPSDGAQRARLGPKTAEEGAPIPLEEAGIIVSGGRGLGGPEPFEMLRELAAALGGALGASRAAVDAGWIPYSHQVGQTGRTVKPNLYIAVGISGAVQHRAGMQTAETIVAINKDPDATIFSLADLGVVGDLLQIVPALTAEIKRRRGA